jgi:hypothetical protein
MEPLLDPLNDRMIKDVPLPPAEPLSDSILFPYKAATTPKTKTGEETKQAKTPNMPDW